MIRLVISVFMVAEGVILLTSESGLYASQTFRVAFELASRQTWGIAFIAAGLLYPVSRRAYSLFGILFVSLCWSGSFVAAIALGYAQSGTAWVPWLCLATCTLLDMRRGEL